MLQPWQQQQQQKQRCFLHSFDISGMQWWFWQNRLSVKGEFLKKERCQGIKPIKICWMQTQQSNNGIVEKYPDTLKQKTDLTDLD